MFDIQNSHTHKKKNHLHLFTSYSWPLILGVVMQIAVQPLTGVGGEKEEVMAEDVGGCDVEQNIWWTSGELVAIKSAGERVEEGCNDSWWQQREESVTATSRLFTEVVATSDCSTENESRRKKYRMQEDRQIQSVQVF